MTLIWLAVLIGYGCVCGWGVFTVVLVAPGRDGDSGLVQLHEKMTLKPRRLWLVGE